MAFTTCMKIFLFYFTIPFAHPIRNTPGNKSQKYKSRTDVRFLWNSDSWSVFQQMHLKKQSECYFIMLPKMLLFTIILSPLEQNFTTNFKYKYFSENQKQLAGIKKNSTYDLKIEVILCHKFSYNGSAEVNNIKAVVSFTYGKK